MMDSKWGNTSPQLGDWVLVNGKPEIKAWYSISIDQIKINPIPIDSEWMLSYRNGLQMRSEYKNGFSDRLNTFHIKFDQYGELEEVIWKGLTIQIRFIHELQQFYRLILREEIKFNPNK